MFELFRSHLTQPYLYLLAAGWLAAMYLIWALAKTKFLGTNQAMNMLNICLIGAWLCAIAVLSAIQLWQGDDPVWWWLLPSPTSLTLLAAYAGGWVAASHYLRRIRYPYWPMMDKLSLSLAPLLVAGLIGYVIVEREVAVLALIGAIVIGFAGLGYAYRKQFAPGAVAAASLIVVFGLAAAAVLTIPSWQIPWRSVELLPYISGVLAGLLLLLLRLTSRAKRTPFLDIPRGVSQGFRETFSRAFAPTQPSNQDGSTNNGGPKP